MLYDASMANPYRIHNDDPLLRAGDEVTLITARPDALRATPGAPPTPQEDCEVAERRLIRAAVRGEPTEKYAELVRLAHKWRAMNR